MRRALADLKSQGVAAEPFDVRVADTGEPDDADIRDRVLARGISLQDLLGFYTLRRNGGRTVRRLPAPRQNENE